MQEKEIQYKIGDRFTFQQAKGTMLDVQSDHVVVVFDNEPGKTYLTFDKWQDIEIIDECLVDYTGQRFFENFVLDQCIGYFSVNQEMYLEETGLVPASYYHVFCVHPRRGSCTFRVEKDEDGNWTSELHPPFIDGDFIDWVGELIESHNRS